MNNDEVFSLTDVIISRHSRKQSLFSSSTSGLKAIDRLKKTMIILNDRSSDIDTPLSLSPKSRLSHPSQRNKNPPIRNDI